MRHQTSLVGVTKLLAPLDLVEYSKAFDEGTSFGTLQSGEKEKLIET